MLASKDYSQMTTEELASEEKRMKSQKIITAVCIGFLVGIAIYAAAIKKSFFLTIALLFFAALIGSRSAQNLKNLQEEISRRNPSL